MTIDDLKSDPVLWKNITEMALKQEKFTGGFYFTDNDLEYFWDGEPVSETKLNILNKLKAFYEDFICCK